MHKNCLPNIAYDNVETHDNIGKQTTYKTCSKDFNSCYDSNLSDDNSKGDGSKCSYEKLQDSWVVRNKKMLAPFKATARKL